MVRSSSQPRWQFWIDRGGTFTDIIAVNNKGQTVVRKLLSEDKTKYQDAAVAGIRQILRITATEKIPARQIELVKLGTTVATNALLEKTGENVVLIITAGFADLLFIGDQRRPQIFELVPRRPAKLYQRVIEVKERVTVNGKVLVKPDLDELRTKLVVAKKLGCKAAAVVCLHSYRYPVHENQIAAVCKEVGFDWVSTSATDQPLLGAVARGQSTVVDSYLSPLLRKYVDGLVKQLNGAKVQFMQSNGGLITADRFTGKNAVLSGPVGGIIAGANIAKQKKLTSIVTLDMGGTSTDVAHWNGSLERCDEVELAGLTLQVPMLRLSTVAAGGGSICEFANDRLKVGPNSAGAEPGPACYRRGGPLTITDCNLILGKIQKHNFPKVFGPQRNLPLSLTTSRDRIVKIYKSAKDQFTSVEQLATGFIDVAVEKMAAEIKKISVQRGYDLEQGYALVSFGGAGGQHACILAERLGIDKIILHPQAGVFSALGIGLAEVRDVQRQSIERPLAKAKASGLLQSTASELVAKALNKVKQLSGSTKIYKRVALRYSGAVTTILVGISTRTKMVDEFTRLHSKQFGFTQPDLDIYAAAVEVEVVVENKQRYKIQSEINLPQTDSPQTELTFCRGRRRKTIIWQRSVLKQGQVITGPAIIIEATATSFIEPDWQGTIDSEDNLILEKCKRQIVERNKRSLALTPARLEVFNSIFKSIAEQMGYVLQNTAVSVNIKERLDFSCAIFDEQGRMVANGPHLPVHLGSMSEGVKAVIAANRTSMKSGDAYLLNSPYAGGTHLPDLTVVSPVFVSGSKQPFCFVCSRGHHADIGGITPGSMPANSETIEQEGVLFENLRIVRNGRFAEQQVRKLLASARYPARNPDQNIADLLAQLAANAKGKAEIQRISVNYGVATVTAFMRYMRDNAAACIRQLIGRLKSGKHTVYNDDGSKVCVAINVDYKQNKLKIDFTGTSKQQLSNINTPMAVVQAAVIYVLRTLLDEDIPLNDGCLTPVNLKIPASSMLNPKSGAAVVAGNVETSQAIVDVLLGALRVAAASQGTMNNLTFGNDRIQYYETICGGAGACHGSNGEDAIHTHMTNSKITDPEIMEKMLPVILETFSIRRNSGGKGLWHGGNGCCRRIRFLEKMQVTVLANRRVVPPFGLAGGETGKLGQNWLEHNGKKIVASNRGKWDVVPGDILEIRTPGGGGWGKL